MQLDPDRNLGLGLACGVSLVPVIHVTQRQPLQRPGLPAARFAEHNTALRGHEPLAHILDSFRLGLFLLTVLARDRAKLFLYPR